jgi:uncharacterized protein YcsI (UPF0317 family)
MEYSLMPPKKVRALIRNGEITGSTAGMCAGYAQANLVILPKEYAYDFLLFSQRNPTASPILEVTDVGERSLRYTAEDVDIATDLPQYRVYRYGKLVDEPTSIEKYWSGDFVTFLIGCSFSFEADLIEANIPVRHVEEGHNVPMYFTNRPCRSAGIFHGNLVVSMRPMLPEQAVRAAAITASMPRVHGVPVHIGDPAAIGIHDIMHPDFGDPVTIKPGEVPVFWCCGVTTQSVVMEAKPSICITHAPGKMLILDIKNSQLKY